MSMSNLSPIEQLNAAIAADPAAFKPAPELPAQLIRIRGSYRIGSGPIITREAEQLPL